MESGGIWQGHPPEHLPQTLDPMKEHSQVLTLVHPLHLTYEVLPPHPQHLRAQMYPWVSCCGIAAHKEPLMESGGIWQGHPHDHLPQTQKPFLASHIKVS